MMNHIIIFIDNGFNIRKSAIAKGVSVILIFIVHVNYECYIHIRYSHYNYYQYIQLTLNKIVNYYKQFQKIVSQYYKIQNSKYNIKPNHSIQYITLFNNALTNECNFQL